MERTDSVDGAVPDDGKMPKLDKQTQSNPQGRNNGTKSQPFTVTLQLDFMQIILFLGALLTRTWHIGYPRAVVFDELHFSKFVALYMRHIFFFDVHPPLGKLLLALAGGYTGFLGDINFERIGSEYPPGFPVKELRLIPAVCGSLVVPLIYQICVELGFSRWAAMLAGSFILLDTAMLVQCRFVLLEGMLLFFMCLALLSYLKFRSLKHRSFSLQWYFWLSLTGVSFTCALSVKYAGVFTALLILYLVARDYWKLLSDFSVSDLSLVNHFLVRFVFLIVVPVTIYLYVFYIHLSLLTRAGPHDTVMTSAFQASLEGGLATLTKGQPLYVAYGSQITLRHTYDPLPGSPCWLHSHQHVYPVRYPDGRGSSHQQQVTCYTFKDVNNWWIVKDPNKESMLVDEPPQPVKNGDIIQLVHGLTSRALNSHDVAAPVNPQHQEVSCYIDYNVSMPAQNLWRVEILNPGSHKGGLWETIKSQVRLVHVNTSQALKTSGKHLPEWAFNQLEVCTDRIIHQEATVWNVEEHRYTRVEDHEEQVRDIAQAEMIPTEPTHLSFWEKFYELQMKMLFMAPDKEMEHKYSSSPLEWPFMMRNVAYWMSGANNAQIHLLGNVVVWISGSLAVLLYSGLLVFYLLRRRRQCFDLTDDEWSHFLFVFDVVVVGYFAHYIPHFLTDRTLFLHHYLPCIVFKVLALAAALTHIDYWLSQTQYGYLVISNLVIIMIAVAAWIFQEFSVIAYGHRDLNPAIVQKLTWMESWDFLLHGHM